MRTGPAALPLASLTPTFPHLPVDLADTPFPFPFRAFLLLPHSCLALFAPAKKTVTRDCSIQEFERHDKYYQCSCQAKQDELSIKKKFP